MYLHVKKVTPPGLVPKPFLFKSLLTVLVMLLAACAALPTARAPAEEKLRFWDSHRAAVSMLERWSIQGRVAIQTEREGWNAAMRWIQRGDTYSLRLIAPFGQGTYELEGNPEGVVMRTPNHQTLIANNPEALMLQNLGWTLPVTGLRYWVRGIPDPNSPIVTIRLDDKGRMTDLQQSGWRISVLDYSHPTSLELPAKLFMHTDRFKLRLVVQRWETE